MSPIDNKDIERAPIRSEGNKTKKHSEAAEKWIILCQDDTEKVFKLSKSKHL